MKNPSDDRIQTPDCAILELLMNVLETRVTQATSKRSKIAVLALMVSALIRCEPARAEFERHSARARPEARPQAQVDFGSTSCKGDKKAKKKKNRKKDDFVSLHERERLLVMASATLDDVRQSDRDILLGPPGSPSPVDPKTGFISHLTLSYSKKKGVSGRTSKFWARDSAGTRWKVKYDSDEVFTEMAASRLLWKMGYGADHVFPVQELVCLGCKDDDPWSSMDHGRDKAAKGKRIVFQNVIIERSLQHFVPGGQKIESFDSQGVSHEEISRITDEAWQKDPDRAADLDSLKALAFMLQHADSKPANQRLVAMRWPETGEGPANRSVVLFQDAGVTFGQGKGNFAVSKFKYKKWRERLANPWIAPPSLTLDLPKSMDAKGGWEYPLVTGKGLRVFLDRAARLDRQDLIAIFRLARFPEGSGVPADQWADTWEMGLANLRARLP